MSRHMSEVDMRWKVVVAFLGIATLSGLAHPLEASERPCRSLELREERSNTDGTSLWRHRLSALMPRVYIRLDVVPTRDYRIPRIVRYTSPGTGAVTRRLGRHGFWSVGVTWHPLRLLRALGRSERVDRPEPDETREIERLCRRLHQLESTENRGIPGDFLGGR